MSQSPDTPDTAAGAPGLAVHRVGSRAILIDLPDLETVLDWHAALTSEPLPGQVEAIAAAETLLVVTDSHAAARDAARRLAEFTPPKRDTAGAREIVIDVVYDGDDLEAAAKAVGKTPEQLIEWHTSTTFTGAFGGFAPGFTYCTAADEADALDVPRRSSPRTAVPAGAVGLAGSFTAVYPRTSPGGWQLIGTTRHRMWDPEADFPAAVRPGDTVRYRAVSEHPAEPPRAERERHARPHRPVARLVSTGMQTLLEDRGRAGHGDLGVTGSGSADRAAARVANSAVGNKPGAAVLENIGRLELTALVDTVVAVTGARADARVRTTPVRLGSPVLLPAGSRLKVGPATLGARTYVALRGGIVAATELGSVATDQLSGLGAAPLEPGALLSVPTDARGTVSPAQHNPVRVQDVGKGRTGAVLRCVPGPRDDWFRDGVAALTSRAWSVTAQSNRVGLRLEPDAVELPVQAAIDAFRTAGPASGGHRAGRVKLAGTTADAELPDTISDAARTDGSATPDGGAAPAGAAPETTDRAGADGTGAHAATARADAAAADAASASRRRRKRGGPPIERVRDGELASEGMIAGCVQVPPNGSPVIFLRDHAVTGGYPVIATVVHEDLDIAAQLPPGARVQLIAVDPDTLEPLGQVTDPATTAAPADTDAAETATADTADTKETK